MNSAVLTLVWCIWSCAFLSASSFEISDIASNSIEQGEKHQEGGGGVFKHRYDPPPPDVQIATTRDLIARLVGANVANNFDLEIIASQGGLDVFELESVNGVVTLRGTTGVALSSAFNYYLKHYLNSSVSWGREGTGNNINVPDVLPAPIGLTRVVSPVKYRYYFNVCTLGYSGAWWNWTRWEQEIDWMALHGYNLILSFTGQEYIEKQLYTSLGLTEQELQEQFSGPAFLPWERMGNFRGWGGPLDDHWITQQNALQKLILARQKNFGMISVLPGFAGHVPKALLRLYPNANITRSPNWGGFPDQYCCDYLLAPIDPLFAKIGAQYVQLQIQTYGFSDHIYNADTFNEMRPASSGSSYLKATSAAVFNAMAQGDPDAKWLMQGWLFQDSDFWNTVAIEAYLSGVADQDMLILDLYSDQSPIYDWSDSYFGKDFIWCMLHNFGGTRSIYGLIDHIASNPIQVKSNSSYTMVGTGITMEAIEQNPVIYALMSDMGWAATEFDTADWLSNYVNSRYYSPSFSAAIPLIQSSWQGLHATLYNEPWDWNCRSLIERQPSLEQGFFTNPNTTAFVSLWKTYLSAASLSSTPNLPPTYLYDLVDFTRQILANIFFDVYGLFIKSYQRKDLFNARVQGSELLLIIDYSDAILASDVNFLLGNWLSDAVSWAETDSQRQLYYFNAKNQITLWGPDGQITDYASKPFAGLYGDFYYHRWSMFLNGVWNALQYGVPFDESAFNSEVLAYSQSWDTQTNTYPTTPVGDSVALANIIRSKYTTSSSSYQKITNMDSPLNDIYHAWTNDVDQLKILCDLDSTCKGFNSNGYIKSNVEGRYSVPGCDLYIKN